MHSKHDTKRKIKRESAAQSARRKTAIARALQKYSRIPQNRIDLLKREDIDVIRSVIAAHSSNPLSPPALKGAFPSTGSQFSQTSPGSFTGNFDIELKWAVARIIANMATLNSFLEIRRAFTRNIMRSEIEEAREALNSIQTKFGLSNWLFESKLLLADLDGGSSELRLQIKSIYELTIPSNYKHLAHFAFLRIDRTRSVELYGRAVTEFIQQSVKTPDADDLRLRAYLNTLLLPNEIANDISDVENAAYCLYSDACRPVIDQYLSLLSLLRSLLASQFKFTASQKTAIQKLRTLTDEDIDYTLDWITSPRTNSRRSTTHECWIDIINGNANDALAKLESMSDTALPTVELMTLKAIAERSLGIHLQCKDSNRQTTESHLYEHIYMFFDLQDNCGLAFIGIFKALLRLVSTPLFFGLKGFCLAHAPFQESSHLREVAVLFGHISPIDLTDLRPPLRNQAIGIFKSQKIPALAELADAIESASRLGCEISPLYPRISPKFATLLDTKISLMRNPQAELSDSFFTLLTTSPLSIDLTAISLANQSAINAFIASGDYRRLARILSTSPLSAVGLCCISRILNLTHHSAFMRFEEINPSIAWPILRTIKWFYSTRGDKFDIFQSYIAFIESEGCVFPSKLPPPDSRQVSERQFVFFLRHVCIPDIMDSDCSYASLGDVLRERTEILQRLQLIDPANTPEYAGEISSIQRELAVKAASKLANECKIAVDIDSLVKILPEALNGLFERLRTFSEMPIEQPNSEWSRWGDLGLSMQLDDGFQDFARAIEEVKSRFLFHDEYGLDSYLSVRIRHQTMRGALRSVFERHGLVTERSLGVYQRNCFFADASNELSDSEELDIQTWLSEFSTEVDQIIEIISSLWMRIRGTVDGSLGKFDFTLDTAELRSFYDDMLPALQNMDFIDFIDAIFNLFLDRLERALDSIRELFEGEVFRLFEPSINELERRIGLLSHPISPLRNALIQLRTDLQNEILAISEWFKFATAPQFADFEIGTLLSASIENINKCFPSSAFNCEAVVETQVMLPARCFAPLWDALFLVFENAVRHAPENCSKLQLVVTQRDGLFIFKSSNPISGLQTASNLSARIDLWLHQDSGSVRAEGGSGLLKLRKLVTKDLKCQHGFVHPKVEGDVFEVSFGFSLN